MFCGVRHLCAMVRIHYRCEVLKFVLGLDLYVCWLTCTVCIFVISADFVFALFDFSVFDLVSSVPSQEIATSDLLTAEQRECNDSTLHICFKISTQSQTLDYHFHCVSCTFSQTKN